MPITGLPGRWLAIGLSCFALLTTLAAVLSSPGGAAGPARTGATRPESKNNCFWELARGQGSELVCQYPAWLADKERDELRRLTRDMLQDAHCTVSIQIDRALVTHTLTEANYTFEAPPQPVTCDIATKESSIPINATFAPRVVIKGGVATDATPGMANVTGVNSYLAWPVVEYVNRSATIRAEMLKMINAYLAMRVARK